MEVKDVDEVADLLPSGQCQQLIQGRIGVMQAVSTSVVLLNGEETEGTVLRPFDSEFLPFPR